MKKVILENLVKIEDIQRTDTVVCLCREYPQSIPAVYELTRVEDEYFWRNLTSPYKTYRSNSLYSAEWAIKYLKNTVTDPVFYVAKDYLDYLVFVTDAVRIAKLAKLTPDKRFVMGISDKYKVSRISLEIDSDSIRVEDIGLIVR